MTKTCDACYGDGATSNGRGDITCRRCGGYGEIPNTIEELSQEVIRLSRRVEWLEGRRA